jgi:transposase-like protein
MAKDLDDQVQAFLLRPIEQAVPYLFVDASYYKIRDGARYVTKAVLVVAGVQEDGYREILGARVTNCENEEFRSGLFEMERVNKVLKRRTKVVGVFPNEESLLRLVRSIQMDINEEWVTGRRYLTMQKE